MQLFESNRNISCKFFKRSKILKRLSVSPLLLSLSLSVSTPLFLFLFCIIDVLTKNAMEKEKMKFHLQFARINWTWRICFISQIGAYMKFLNKHPLVHSTKFSLLNFEKFIFEKFSLLNFSNATRLVFTLCRFRLSSRYFCKLLLRTNCQQLSIELSHFEQCLIDDLVGALIRNFFLFSSYLLIWARKKKRWKF